MTKQEIQFVRSLADKRSRDEHHLFIAEGDKLIGEIIKSGFKIRNIYALEGHLAGQAEVVSAKEMERISQLKTAASSLAVVEQPRHKAPATAPANRLSIALDGVQNPGNLGTIIRLADWFGVEDIYCSEDTADCFNPKVVQATMGAILRVKVHYLSLADFLARTASAGTPIYGTMLDGDNIYDAKLQPNGVIVMGNEGKGVSDECAKHFSHKLLIPSYPPERQGSESLNVAMATGIVCAEFRRRAMK
ncbi:MAG: RNA methyltransferase [Alistipes sp.]|nr:RNA methyltransferase [Alistipes sp.]